MTKNAIRKIFWVVFLGATGAYLQTKSAVISDYEVVLGFVVGASLGWIMANIFSAKNGYRRRGKQKN